MKEEQYIQSKVIQWAKQGWWPETIQRAIILLSKMLEKHGLPL